MQISISEGLSYCLITSKSKPAPQIDELRRQNDVKADVIAYTQAMYRLWVGEHEV